MRFGTFTSGGTADLAQLDGGSRRVSVSFHSAHGPADHLAARAGEWDVILARESGQPDHGGTNPPSGDQSLFCSSGTGSPALPTLRRDDILGRTARANAMTGPPEVVVETLDHAAAEAVPEFDGTIFRRVIGNFMSGVVVITTSDDGQPRGMTVSAVSSLSLDPPMLLACLHSASSTQEAVRRSGRFAVNILAEGQDELAERFARPGGGDKFDGVSVRTGYTGVPLLEGALAVVECRVAEAVTGGTHRVFLGEVVHAEAGEGSPLAYFRGKFGKLEIAQDAETYLRLRRLVLSRVLGLGGSSSRMIRRISS